MKIDRLMGIVVYLLNHGHTSAQRLAKKFENGDFEFCFAVPEHETFWYGVLLSFGNKATIIEPTELKQRILQTCREMEQLYEEGELT